MYETLMFIQGEEAHEWLEYLDAMGAERTLQQLRQEGYWDIPEYSFDEAPWGECDKLHFAGDYVLNYNTAIGYIGVVRVRKVLDKIYKNQL